MKMRTVFCYFFGFALAVSLTACGNNQKAAEQKNSAPEATVATGAPASVQQPPAAPGVITGKVLESSDASGYTYVKLDDGSKDGLWAAVPKTALKVGEEVTLKGCSVMNNFSSKTLKKTFDKIIFASGIVRGDEAGAAGDFASAVAKGTGTSGMASGGSAASIVPFADLKVAKAAGDDARTVGELFEQRQALNAKTVSIKGQVVKISKNIMGKNWIHLQDGTGDPMKNTHDLVVTTQNVAAKGDIVTIKGTVESDKDFGSGYKYKVIVEEATVVKDASAGEPKVQEHK